MLKFINKAFKSASAFLSTGKVPPSTDIIFREEMKRTNHFASRKFFIVFTSFIGLCFFYFSSVAILFFLPSSSEYITGYVTIFSRTIEVLAIVIAAYLGVQAMVDLKYNSSTNTNLENITSIEKIDEHIIEEETIKYAKIYQDDISYAPIEWVESFDANENY